MSPGRNDRSYFPEHLRTLLFGPHGITGGTINEETLAAYEAFVAERRHALRLRRAKGLRDDCPGPCIDVQCCDGEHRDDVLRAAGSVCQIRYTDSTGTRSIGTGALVREPDV